jgi:hypothetical protein
MSPHERCFGLLKTKARRKRDAFRDALLVDGLSQFPIPRGSVIDLTLA